MRKVEELSNPGSCMSRAKPDEMTFVLLGRDAAAPHAIREWAKKRIKLRKNKLKDAQIQDALTCADIMERELLGEPNRCCENGFFGKPHNCRKSDGRV